jgi:hypothetical protein
MKYRSTSSVSDYLHLFLYGDGGTGKTKAAADFHERGQNVVLVTTEQDGDIPLHTRGIEAPVLIPETEDDLIAIISATDQVVSQVIHRMPGFAAYVPKTWVFDGLRSLQRVVLGQSAKQARTALDGLVSLPEQEAHGVMALPAKRAPGIPSNPDYRRLDLNMRNYVGGIEKMPYHTIITAHVEKDYSIETKGQLTGDQEIDKSITRNFYLFPSLEGYSLKYDLPALCSSYYLLLDAQNNRYSFKAHKGVEYHARTRVAEVMPTSPVDWTGKNLYDLLQGKVTEARNKLTTKQKEKP